MGKIKLKKVTLTYEDGKEVELKEAMVIELKSKGALKELRVRTAGFKENSLQEYIKGLIHFIAEHSSQETMNELEAEADYLEGLSLDDRSRN